MITEHARAGDTHIIPRLRSGGIILTYLYALTDRHLGGVVEASTCVANIGASAGHITHLEGFRCDIDNPARSLNNMFQDR